MYRSSSIRKIFHSSQKIPFVFFLSFQNPVTKAKRKVFFKCCCGTTDPLEIVARVPVGGYTPGQFVNLDMEVKNKSNEPVSQFTVEMVQVWNGRFWCQKLYEIFQCFFFHAIEEIKYDLQKMCIIDVMIIIWNFPLKCRKSRILPMVAEVHGVKKLRTMLEQQVDVTHSKIKIYV